VVDLGGGYATDINDAAEVVGVNDRRHVQLWSHGVSMEISTGSSTCSCNFSCSCLVSTIKGDPSFVQIDRYASADLAALKGTIIPFTISDLTRYGESITLLSIKNSVRYLFTSFTSVESGEPRFIKMIALLFVSMRRQNYRNMTESIFLTTLLRNMTDK